LDNAFEHIGFVFLTRNMMNGNNYLWHCHHYELQK